MAKNETNAVVPYKVQYNYINPDGFLRTGAIVLEKATPEEAKTEAETRLAAIGHKYTRITRVKPY